MPPERPTSPNSTSILFSAIDRTRDNEGVQDIKLYRVATGLNPGEEEAQFTPDIELILDNTDYQNLQFKLAADGEAIAVRRVSRKDPSDFGLWLLRPEQEPQPIGLSGGDFAIAPDGKTLAVPQGEGIGIFSCARVSH